MPPLVATAQRYEETHPGVRIHWQKRTLDEFGHVPIDVLTQKFDLIVIDHPWAGFCFEKNLVRDLKPLVPAAALAELAKNSVGQTFNSYRVAGQDCWRCRLTPPRPRQAGGRTCWNGQAFRRRKRGRKPSALARRKLAVIPGFNADLFLHFIMLVKGLGAEPCSRQ